MKARLKAFFEYIALQLASESMKEQKKLIYQAEKTSKCMKRGRNNYIVRNLPEG